MSLERGHRLAHYEIVELIGKGGMGEVYRAIDAKLGRDVAIKVLPVEFAAHEDRLKRFQREARVLASLNHPNIASIYGLEEEESTHFLVLELVNGETLDERIARGPIPIDKALAIAIEIAHALEEAHERGVVHRDLKPANIKLTRDDKVKVLDFGLAKAFVEEPPAVVSSNSPTITRDATRAGDILGTAAYMSPEQAEGRVVDKRADIWAFGVVLFEMLSGTKAFAGDNVTVVLASVLKMEPEWGLLPRTASTRLRELLRGCLEKDAKQRWRDIGDVRINLERSQSGRDAKPAAGAPRATWMVLAASGAALAVGAALSVLPSSSPNAVVKTSIDLAPSGSLGFDNPGANALTRTAISLSPDGKILVFNAFDGEVSRLYWRPLGLGLARLRLGRNSPGCGEVFVLGRSQRCF